MASALVGRAREHQDWIGDDHGDRYEKAMLAGSVPEAMQIVVKEAIDHLRSALDYCAQEVWLRHGAKPKGAKVYFPIARDGSSEEDFSSLMNRCMPGVLKASPNCYAVMRQFQVFASDRNAWLPELATLSNQAKHDHLEIASTPHTLINVTYRDGVALTRFVDGHGPKRGVPWMMIKTDGAGGLPEGCVEVVFLQLRQIRAELSLFLREATQGVAEVIAACRMLT